MSIFITRQNIKFVHYKRAFPQAQGHSNWNNWEHNGFVFADTIFFTFPFKMSKLELILRSNKLELRDQT